MIGKVTGREGRRIQRLVPFGKKLTALVPLSFAPSHPLLRWAPAYLRHIPRCDGHRAHIVAEFPSPPYKCLLHSEVLTARTRCRIAMCESRRELLPLVLCGIRSLDGEPVSLQDYVVMSRKGPGKSEWKGVFFHVWRMSRVRSAQLTSVHCTKVSDRGIGIWAFLGIYEIKTVSGDKCVEM